MLSVFVIPDLPKWGAVPIVCAGRLVFVPAGRARAYPTHINQKVIGENK